MPSSGAAHGGRRPLESELRDFRIIKVFRYFDGYSAAGCRHLPPQPSEPSGDNVPSQIRTAAADPDAEDGKPGLAERPAPTAGAILDPDAIFISTGAVPYAWRLDTDELAWGANAGEVLAVPNAALIASGCAYARLVDQQDGRTRFDAVLNSGTKDDGTGVPYQVQYALRPTPDSAPLHWIEDSGRWFAGSDGTPARAHGIVRVIDSRREQEQQLAYLSRFDALTNEMNRWHLTAVLEHTVAEAIRLRSSCGFMLASIDSLGRINEAYGFNIADEVIAAMALRIRSQLRGQDRLGRFSGNKFGIILNNCTPDDMLVAADRVLVGARDAVVQTSVGPVAVTVTIGGVTAPRHARNVGEVLARAQDALDSAKAKRRGSFSRPIGRVPSGTHGARKTFAPPTRSSRRSTSAGCPWSTSRSWRSVRVSPPSMNALCAFAAATAACWRSMMWCRLPSASASCACSTTACSNWC